MKRDTTMSRILEDFLCGLLGYNLGKNNREFTQQEAEGLIRSFLRAVPLDAVIGYWMEANCYSRQSGLVADTLRRKADEVDDDFMKN